MKIKITLVSLVMLCVVALIVYISFRTSEELPTGPTLSLGDAVIHLEIADTEEKQALGLGGRESFPETAGMLFVFPVPDLYGSWMLGMRFSLDIVWLEANGDKFRVIDMKKNVSLDTYPEIFYPSAPTSYILEINAGAAKKNGITLGSVLTFRE